MTSKQTDAITNLLLTCDEFIHAFDREHPEITIQVEQLALAVAEWAAPFGPQEA